MGWLEGFARALQGKPAFEGDDGARPSDENGQKVVPMVTIDRVKADPDGPDINLYAYVTNHSTTPLLLDKARFLGQTREVDTDLGPDSTREVLLYKGPRLTEARGLECDLIYRTADTGDYFSTLYYAECKRETDGTYTVVRFKLQRQIKDI